MPPSGGLPTAPRAAPGLPRRHVRRRRPASPTRRSATGTPGGATTGADRRSRSASCPPRPGNARRPPGEGERQMDPVWMDGVVYYMSERGLGQQRLVLRPGHRRGAAGHAPRRLRRDVPRCRRRGGGLRAGRLPARNRSGHRRLAPIGHQRGRRHELVAPAVGDGSGRRPARRPPVADRQAGDLRMAGRALQRAGRRGFVAQSDAHPRGGRPSPGVVAGRVGASPGSTTTATSTAW